MGRRNGEPARSDYLAAAVSEPDPDIKLVLDVLEDVKSIGTAGAPQWEARCPVHEDRRPSFHVSPGKRYAVVVDCKAGCKPEAIRAKLKQLGVPQGLVGVATGAASTRKGKKPVALPQVQPIDERKVVELHRRLVDPSEGGALDYLLSERGLSLDTVEKYTLGWDGRRITIPVRDGSKVVDLRRCKPHCTGDEPKVVSYARGYGGSRLYPSQALGVAGPVLFCEGELDTLIALDRGLVAVTGTGGASTPPADLGKLAGRDVYVAYDCDEAGRNGAEKLAAALRGAGAAHVTVLDLTELGCAPESREDVTDVFVKYNRTADDVRALMERTGEAAREPERLRLVGPEELAAPVPPMRWLVRGVWPEGSYGVLAGEKKTLKTYTALALAVAVTSGQPFLGHFDVPRPGAVLYLSGEGGQYPTTARLQRIAAAYGLDRDELGQLPLHMLFSSAALDDPEFLAVLRGWLDKFRPALVVLDPLYAFHPSGVEATNLYERGRMLADFRAAIGPDTALVVVDHFKKTGASALDLDSVAQAGMAQWADSWVLQRHGEQARPDEGHFALDVEFGSRQWGGRTYRVTWGLGEFDDSTGEHVGDLAYKVESGERARDRAADDRRNELAERALACIVAEPWQHTQSKLVKLLGGRKERAEEALKTLVLTGRVEVQKHPVSESGRPVRREVYGPVGDGHTLRSRNLPPLDGESTTADYGSAPETAGSGAKRPSPQPSPKAGMFGGGARPAGARATQPAPPRPLRG